MNSKKYVGQTGNGLLSRLSQHNRAKTYIGSAMKKYGKENFKIQLLSIAENKEEADELERHYIMEYDTLHPHGYNLTTGGQGGFNHTRETRGQMAVLRKGRLVSEGTRKRMSEAKRGQKHPLFGRRGINSPRYGKIHTQVTRDRIKKSLKGKFVGKYVSEETKEKIGRANRGEKHGMFGNHHTQEYVNKRSHTWNIIFPDGHEEVIVNMREFCRTHNLNVGNMVQVSRGKQQYCKGFRCHNLTQLNKVS